MIYADLQAPPHNTSRSAGKHPELQQLNRGGSSSFFEKPLVVSSAEIARKNRTVRPTGRIVNRRLPRCMSRMNHAFQLVGEVENSRPSAKVRVPSKPMASRNEFNPASVASPASPEKELLPAMVSKVVSLSSCTTQNKKADVAEHPEAFHHVGLLFNGSSAVADYPLFSLPITALPKTAQRLSIPENSPAAVTGRAA